MRWTDEMKLRMVQLCLKHKGYIRTEDNMNEKWNEILNAAKMDPLFIEMPKNYSAMSLQNKFKACKDEVLLELGITKEGANLSGLPSTMTEYQSLLVAMAEEVHKKTYSAAQDKAKKERQQVGLLTHEINQLARQSGTPRPSLSRLPVDSDSSDPEYLAVATPAGADGAASRAVKLESGGSDDSGAATGKRRGVDVMDRFASTILKITQDDPEVREAELQAKRVRLQLEERQLRLQEEAMAAARLAQEREHARHERELALHAKGSSSFSPCAGKQYRRS